MADRLTQAVQHHATGDGDHRLTQVVQHHAAGVGDHRLTQLVQHLARPKSAPFGATQVIQHYAVPKPSKFFSLIDAVETAPAVRLRPDPAVFDRLLAKQQHVFDTYGPVRPPWLRESGDPDFVGRAARFGIEVPTLGDVEGLDAYVLEPGCFDDALASGRAVVLLELHNDRLVLASTLTGALQLETDATGLRVGVLCPELVELWDQGVRFAGLSGFSNHHSQVYTMPDGRRVAFVHRAELVEVSLVAEPGTPRAPGTWLERSTPAAWSRFDYGE